jgi:hypothetical protein
VQFPYSHLIPFTDLSIIPIFAPDIFTVQALEDSEETAAVENDEASGLTVHAQIQDVIEHLDPTHKNFDRASRFLLVGPHSHTNNSACIDH